MLSDLFSLQGKIALITGGSRGIGKAIAMAFAEAGADLVISSRNKRPPELENVAGQARAMGRKVLAIPAHVGKREEVETLVQETLTAFGRIDILGRIRSAKPSASGKSSFGVSANPKRSRGSPFSSPPGQVRSSRVKSSGWTADRPSERVQSLFDPPPGAAGFPLAALDQAGMACSP